MVFIILNIGALKQMLFDDFKSCGPEADGLLRILNLVALKPDGLCAL